MVVFMLLSSLFTCSSRGYHRLYKRSEVTHWFVDYRFEASSLASWRLEPVESGRLVALAHWLHLSDPEFGPWFKPLLAHSFGFMPHLLFGSYTTLFLASAGSYFQQTRSDKPTVLFLFSHKQQTDTETS